MNDCTSCVGGIKSDGSTCMWFEEYGFCASGCGQIGCGVTECSAEISSTTEATTTTTTNPNVPEAEVTTTGAVNPNGNVPAVNANVPGEVNANVPGEATLEEEPEDGGTDSAAPKESAIAAAIGMALVGAALL